MRSSRAPRARRTPWALALAAAVALAGGCGPKHRNRCPGYAPRGCISGQVCTFDHKKGCHACQCRSLNEIPMGEDPDDRGPALPVH